MFFYVSKILSFLTHPLTWFFILIGVFYVDFKKNGRFRYLFFALALLYICSNSFIVDELYRLYETRTPDYDLTKVNYKAGIILGGVCDIDLRKNEVDFAESADRLFQSLRLLNAGATKTLIFTGGSGSMEFPDKKEALFIKKFMQDAGIPDSSFIFEWESRNTFENALYTKKITDSLGITKDTLWLITSAYHMPRSLAIFKKAGFKVKPFVTDPHSGPRRFAPDFLLIPNSQALRDLSYLLHEWIGFLVYKIKGYC